jgi:hypothetical protein
MSMADKCQSTGKRDWSDRDRLLLAREVCGHLRREFPDGFPRIQLRLFSRQWRGHPTRAQCYFLLAHLRQTELKKDPLYLPGLVDSLLRHVTLRRHDEFLTRRASSLKARILRRRPGELGIGFQNEQQTFTTDEMCKALLYGFIFHADRDKWELVRSDGGVLDENTCLPRCLVAFEPNLAYLEEVVEIFGASEGGNNAMSSAPEAAS